MEDRTRVKTSWYIDPLVLKALNVVRVHDGMPISRQIEMGAKMYLEKHKELLEEHNVNPWEQRSE